MTIIAGLVLIGLFYAARNSRRARVADAMHRHPAGTAHRHAAAAARHVEAQHGLTAWVQCVLCGHRFITEGLLPDELRDCLDNPSPTCPRCVDVLVATEKDLAQ